jgi:phosphonoacetate hydrolase
MRDRNRHQRMIIGLLDGLGTDCYEASAMPSLKKMAQDGLFRNVQGVFPSVTNVNNVSVCCGSWPDQHGISANSYYDAQTDKLEYMNSAELIRTETVFQRATQWGMASALLTSKRKTAELFCHGTVVNIAAEAPTPDQVKRYGQPPDIYSREINYWLWQAAIDLLENRSDIDLIYVHTTDYPMHAWGEEEPESQEHLSKIDKLIRAGADAALDAAFLFTADHGMNRKKRCWDLSRVCARAGVPVRFVLSPERDYYLQHHRNFTGCAWVWLKSATDGRCVKEIIADLVGVEEILERKDTALRFHVPAEHLGDLVVLGDTDTMFGELDDKEGEELPTSYRAHGSLYEMDVPLIVYNYQHPMPPAEFFRHNFDVTRFLLRA